MKNGNCFYWAFDVIHNVHEMIPAYFEANGKETSEINLDSDVFVVHGLVKMPAGHHGKHAWIEAGNYVIDYANENEIFVEAPEYYRAFEVQMGNKFLRNNIFALLLQDRSVAYRGDYTRADLTRIYASNDVSSHDLHSRDFQKEYLDLKID